MNDFLPSPKAPPPTNASNKDLANHFTNSKQIMEKVNKEPITRDRRGNNVKAENEFIEDIDAHERKLNSKWMQKEWKRALDTGRMIEKYCEGLDNRTETIRSEVKALKDAMPREDHEAHTGTTADLRSMLNVVLAEGDMTEDDLIALMNDKIQYYVDFSKGEYRDTKKVFNSSGEITDNSSGKYLFFSSIKKARSRLGSTPVGCRRNLNEVEVKKTVSRPKVPNPINTKENWVA